MRTDFICGVLYAIGIAMISKGAYELGRNRERKELVKLIKTIEVAKDVYDKEKKES